MTTPFSPSDTLYPSALIADEGDYDGNPHGDDLDDAAHDTDHPAESETDTLPAPPPLDRCFSVVAPPDGAPLSPGWGCHECRTYNDAHRIECRACGHTRCNPLDADPISGLHLAAAVAERLQ